MWLSFRLGHGLRLGVPWWIAVPLLPIIIFVLIIVAAIEAVALLIAAPFRLAATAAPTRRPQRGELHFSPTGLASTIGRLEANGYTENPTNDPHTRRWTSPDHENSLTITYDAAGEAMAGAWHGPR
jgi:hypothetical protein